LVELIAQARRITAQESEQPTIAGE
jgi:hypothetical protein